MEALEGVTQDASLGMASFSHNPTAFASSASPSNWLIDSGVTDHVIGIRSEFQSYTTTNDGRVRIADGSYTHKAGRVLSASY